MESIVGKYKTAKVYSMIGETRGVFPVEEVMESMKDDPMGLQEFKQTIEGYYEFTEDHRILEWYKIPEGCSEEEIQSAREAGEIADVRDGYFTDGDSKPWKEEDGKFWYDTKQHREMMGEILSSWDELKEEDGLIVFGGGFAYLKKID